MTTRTFLLAAALAALLGAAAILPRVPRAAPAPAPGSAAPVATVRLDRARVRDLPVVYDGYAEVLPGQIEGLSFARAGQLSRLDAAVGTTARRGAVLAELRADPAALAAYAQAQGTLELARREAARQRELEAGQLATRSQVDAAEKAVADARAALEALARQGGGSPASTLLAPFDGVVTALTAAQGDRLPAGAPVLQFGRTDRLKVVIGIEATRAGAPQPGAPVELRAIAGGAADPPASAVATTLWEVQGTLDPKSGQWLATAWVTRAQAPDWRPGSRLAAHVVLGHRPMLAVPRDAVLSDEEGDYVFQVVGARAHRVAVRREVEAGEFTGISGLTDPQAPVVVLGNYELEDGMAVKVGAP